MKKFIAVFIFGALFIGILALAFMILFGKIKPQAAVFGQLVPAPTTNYSTSSRYDVGVSNWFPKTNALDGGVSKQVSKNRKSEYILCDKLMSDSSNAFEVENYFDTSNLQMLSRPHDEDFLIWSTDGITFLFDKNGLQEQGQGYGIFSVYVEYGNDNNIEDSLLFGVSKTKIDCNAINDYKLPDNQLDLFWGDVIFTDPRKNHVQKVFAYNNKKIKNVSEGSRRYIRDDNTIYVVDTFNIVDSTNKAFKYVSIGAFKNKLFITIMYLGDAYRVEDLIKQVSFDE